MRTIKLITRKGSVAMLTLPIEIFPMPEVMNRHTPTGGVVKPMIRFSTAMTANWTGSTPTLIAILSNTGNSINKAAIVSINAPTKRRRIFIKSNRIYLLCVIFNIVSARYCGICSLAIIQAKRLAKPTRTISEAVVIEDLSRILIISLTFSCL